MTRIRRSGYAARVARLPRRALVIGSSLIVILGPSLSFASSGQAARRPRASARSSSASGATRLLNQAFADARAAGSFRQYVTQSHGRSGGALEDDVSLHDGRQVIVSANGARSEILVIGQTAYLAGNLQSLASFFRFSSDQAAAIGTDWLTVPASSSDFAALTYDVTVPTALSEVAPAGHLSEGAPTTIDGKRVIGITGAVSNAAGGGQHGTDTIYVTASAHPLPVAAYLHASGTSHPPLPMTVTMGHWGERVAITRPTMTLTIAQMSSLAQQLGALAIPHASGYFRFAGPHGYPVPAGRPWGSACKPVRLAAGPSVPDSFYSQLAAVVADARGQGIDVTLQSRHGSWNHGALYYQRGQRAATSVEVKVGVSGGTPPRLPDGQPETIQIVRQTRVDSDKRNDDLTLVSGTLWLKALAGQPQSLRHAIRVLIAVTQGVGLTTEPQSGIADTTSTDGFTAGDVAAMLTMSGCVPGSGTTNTTGVAARAGASA